MLGAVNAKPNETVFSPRGKSDMWYVRAMKARIKDIKAGGMGSGGVSSVEAGRE